MKLSILIPTLIERTVQMYELSEMLHAQINILSYQNQIEILKDVRGREITTGEKRNSLLRRAVGEYVCFIDDDDKISADYLKLIFEGINRRCDCCSLKGIMTTNGGNPEIFEHSLKYKEWKSNPTGEVKYERTINHLNVIRADIARKFKFPEKTIGEDHDWSNQLHESGLIKTEHYIPDVIYFYQYKTKK